MTYTISKDSSLFNFRQSSITGRWIGGDRFNNPYATKTHYPVGECPDGLTAQDFTIPSEIEWDEWDNFIKTKTK